MAPSGERQAKRRASETAFMSFVNNLTEAATIAENAGSTSGPGNSASGNLSGSPPMSAPAAAAATTPRSDGASLGGPIMPSALTLSGPVNSGNGHAVAIGMPGRFQPFMGMHPASNAASAVPYPYAVLPWGPETAAAKHAGSNAAGAPANAVANSHPAAGLPSTSASSVGGTHMHPLYAPAYMNMATNHAVNMGGSMMGLPVKSEMHSGDAMMWAPSADVAPPSAYGDLTAMANAQAMYEAAKAGFFLTSTAFGAGPTASGTPNATNGPSSQVGAFLMPNVYSHPHSNSPVTATSSRDRPVPILPVTAKSNKSLAPLAMQKPGAISVPSAFVPLDVASAGDNVSRFRQLKRYRETHNEVERRRRENINHVIGELASMVPECYPGQSKGSILRKTADFIRSLQQQGIIPPSSGTDAAGAAASGRRANGTPGAPRANSPTSSDTPRAGGRSGSAAASSESPELSNEEDADSSDELAGDVEERPIPLWKGADVAAAAKVEDRISSETGVHQHTTEESRGSGYPRAEFGHTVDGDVERSALPAQVSAKHSGSIDVPSASRTDDARPTHGAEARLATAPADTQRNEGATVEASGDHTASRINQSNVSLAAPHTALPPATGLSLVDPIAHLSPSVAASEGSSSTLLASSPSRGPPMPITLAQMVVPVLSHAKEPASDPVRP